MTTEIQSGNSGTEFNALRWSTIKIAQHGIDPFPSALVGDVTFCEMERHRLENTAEIAAWLVMVWNPQTQIVYRSWRMCTACQEGTRFLHAMKLNEEGN